MEELLLIHISFVMLDDDREKLARKVSLVVKQAMDIADDKVNVSMQSFVPNESEKELIPKPERDTDTDGF